HSYPENEKSLDWFLPPPPLISEIPNTQELEEEIESHKFLGQEKSPKMLTSNLKNTNEDIHYISPTQDFQFPSYKYEYDYLNLGVTGINDLSHVAGKLTYGSSQKYKNHMSTKIAPEENVPDDTKLGNLVEKKEESIPAFRKRLFKICDNMHGGAYSNNSENLNSPVDSVKIVQTEMNKGKSWNCSNNKQKPQSSMFIANDAFSSSKIGDDIFKVPSFSLASQPHDIQVAPIKALCSQRFEDWKEKFGPFGLNCKELTGDTVMDDLFEIQHAHIIMTTPVHVVKDENRGPTLEVVVSRMKTVQSLSQSLENTSTLIPMRFVAVSATIPNAEDIAEWISDGERPAVCLKMDESHRPVKLRKVVLGFPCSSNQTEFKFDLTLNYKIASVIQTYSDQKPTLVFCATRKGVQQAASILVKDAKFIMTVEQKQRLQKCAYSIRDSKLRDILIHGVAYHHAGMELSDRKVVEGAFTTGDLPVLFTTSTLAMGVNLPAHLVVIKSTMHYAGGMFEEYSETDILQMIGRAGRPQITRYSDTVAEILVTIILRNFEQLQNKRTAPDSHYATLIIGDADNQVVFKHRIMDSALLKTGNWTKKIDVKRALMSEDLSINLISSEFVGLDIQQKFTVFYLGPKRFGNQIIIQRKSETEISHSKYPARSTVAGPNKEVLNVNFELGNEVWDDFDDENLIEVTSFSIDTENTENAKISGSGNTLISSTRGSKLPLQQSKSKFQREMAAWPPTDGSCHREQEGVQSSPGSDVGLRDWNWMEFHLIPSVDQLRVVDHPLPAPCWSTALSSKTDKILSRKRMGCTLRALLTKLRAQACAAELPQRDLGSELLRLCDAVLTSELVRGRWKRDGSSHSTCDLSLHFSRAQTFQSLRERL
ncbi:putative ATP-dependent DNA helicase HFM1, partial [Sciurus carolinensis]|nr:putative ATP-dependent DNA helicase HFM1 [Sciurus carolinensis]